MDKIELVRLIYANLKKSPIRVLLTGIGVAIATSLIILMISIGIAIKKNIVSQLSGLGVKYINVFQINKKHPLNKIIMQKILLLPEVESVTPLLFLENTDIKFKNKKINSQIIGINPEYLKNLNLKLKEGDMLFNSSLPIGITGYRFGGNNQINDKKLRNIHQQLLKNGVTLIIREKYNFNFFKEYKIKIIGILEERGSSMDYALFLNENFIKKIKKWQGENNLFENEIPYNQFIVKVKNTKSVEKIEKAIQRMGYRTFSNKNSVKRVNKVYLILQILLGSIGIISLLVSAFGIINTMMMSIYERRREIGIMKAIGAKKADIIYIFLGEASIIGLIGGIIGILFSLFTTKIIIMITPIITSKFSSTFSFFNNLTISITTILLALFFSIFFGMLAGTYPAIKISKMKASEILRYE